ncbi:MAG: addiction module toxin RelE [Bacteroidota bacterium]|nr:addiction module toxin RelE [Bacteroidota bacterium]
MKVIVRISKSFKRQAKPLLKKYPSLKQDLSQLEQDLINNPRMGIPLGQDSYKIRLATKSKNKGKSGGLRVISHLETEILGITEFDGENITLILISIYDKGETATITDKELKDLINNIELS